MNGNIWEVLGVEPTTDKKIIQQAYAEKLAKYHPEEHPEMLQQLQEAYRKAVQYSQTRDGASGGGYRNVNTHLQSERRSTAKQPMINRVYHEPSKPIRKIIHDENSIIKLEPFYHEAENKNRIESDETEQIPEYISQVQNAEMESLYEEDINKYVALFEEKFIGFTSKQDLEEINGWFRDNRFCTILGLKEFHNRLSTVMDFYEMWNQKALAELYKQTERLVNENIYNNTNLLQIKDYFDSKIKKEKNEKIEVGIRIKLYFLVILLSLVWSIIDSVFR